MIIKDSPLLQILQDGKLHSGEQLAQKLGITRSAIWKHIQQLESVGLAIRSYSGKGYCLEGGIELLEEQKILTCLSREHRKQLQALALLDSIPSTNDYILNELRQGHSLPLACLAEQQTQGRGRNHRHWISPYGNNIYFSLGWHFSKDPAELVGLSLLGGLAVINAIKRYGLELPLQLKWPNDILHQGQKLGGVLIEAIAQAHSNCQVVLGIGINTQLPAHTEINQKWTSLDKLSSPRISRNRLAALLLDEAMSLFKQFEIKGLASFIEQWRQFDYCKNQRISLQHGQQKVEGIAQGISDRGELLLLTSTGELKSFLSGEVQQVRALN